MPSTLHLSVTVAWRGSFLAADLSINCDSHRYHSMVAYASFMVLVFPLGFPLSYLLAMWTVLPHVYPMNAGRIFERRLVKPTRTSGPTSDSSSGDEKVTIMSEDEQDAWERGSSALDWVSCACCRRSGPSRGLSGDAQAQPTKDPNTVTGTPYVLISINTYNVVAEHIEGFEMHIRSFLFDILRRRFVMKRYGTGLGGQLRYWLSKPVPGTGASGSDSGVGGANRPPRRKSSGGVKQVLTQVLKQAVRASISVSIGGYDPDEFNPNNAVELSGLVSKVELVGSSFLAPFLT